jgi:hypothetical protein
MAEPFRHKSRLLASSSRHTGRGLNMLLSLSFVTLISTLAMADEQVYING